MKTNRTIVGGLAVLLAAWGASAQGRGGRRGGEPPDMQQQAQAQPVAENAQARRLPPPEEKSVVTHHSMHIGGQTLNYAATAATYIIKDDAGNPKATFFFVAYTKDDVPDITRRPISFLYNGGPGSASLFVHMGMGPRRVVLTPDGHGMPAPYSVADDEDTFLDASDLVFVDAVGTGYSRPVIGETPAQFYGVVEDANIFSDFIYQYITRNSRWASPKFLIGESYGTTRSAQLSGVLEHRHEIYLNGIVLISTVAFAAADPDARAAFPFPSYAATAWYHHLLPPDLQKESIEQVVQQARDFCRGEYYLALKKGDALPAAEKEKVVAQIARFTGLKPKFIEETNLRISSFRWFKELLRDKRETVGRLDSRFVGMDADAAGERPEYDPSEASYEGAFVGAFQNYVRNELKWDSEMYYAVSGNVRPWDNTGNQLVAETLRSAMTEESSLKVLVVCGYYDFATPLFGIEYTVDHMGLEPSIRKNISFAYYESGHMVYIDRKAHDKLHTDVDNFINAGFTH